MEDCVDLIKSTSQSDWRKSKALEEQLNEKKDVECLWFRISPELFVIKIDSTFLSPPFRFLSTTQRKLSTNKWDFQWPSKTDTSKSRALFCCWAPSMQITMLFCVSIRLTRFTWHAFHAPQLSVINSKRLLHNERISLFRGIFHAS